MVCFILFEPVVAQLTSNCFADGILGAFTDFDL